MRFTEFNLFGVYVRADIGHHGGGGLALIPLRRIASRLGVLRHVWHPALFVFAAYMIVLSSIVLVAAR
jgi:protein AaeX